MKYLRLDLPTPEQHLAADEVLLDLCESGAGGEVLCTWAPREYFVVVGYANHVSTEVNVSACEADSVRVLRRCTGGGTVLQGPGCWNYSLFLRFEENGPLHTITGANRHIMQRHRDALATALGRPVEVRGHTDLALDGRKFSGNSQRRKRHCLLFHGCFLLDLDFARVERCLRMPSQQPDYRHDRSHTEFLANLGVGGRTITDALRAAWNATESLDSPPLTQIAQLARDKYSAAEWTHRFP